MMRRFDLRIPRPWRILVESGEPIRVAGYPKSTRSYVMFNYEETLQAMRSQRASMQQELDRLDRAISALQAVVGNPAPVRSTPKPSVQRRREVSQTQEKRLVKGRQAKNAKEKKAEKAKPKISAQGLRNIAEAQRKRWAKVRAAAKARAKPASGKKVLKSPTTE